MNAITNPNVNKLFEAYGNEPDARFRRLLREMAVIEANIAPSNISGCDDGRDRPPTGDDYHALYGAVLLALADKATYVMPPQQVTLTPATIEAIVNGVSKPAGRIGLVFEKGCALWQVSVVSDDPRIVGAEVVVADREADEGCQESLTRVHADFDKFLAKEGDEEELRPVHPIITYISVDGAQSVADHLTRAMVSVCPIPLLDKWQEVRDALQAIANDTDQIRTRA